MDAAKIVNAAVLGKDFETVIVNGKAYVINPPTIHKMAGAGYYLSDLKGATTVMDMLRSLKDVNLCLGLLKGMKVFLMSLREGNLTKW